MNRIKGWFKKLSWKIIGKFLYNSVLRPYLKEASTRSDNKIDDAALDELDKVIKGL